MYKQPTASRHRNPPSLIESNPAACDDQLKWVENVLPPCSTCGISDETLYKDSRTCWINEAEVDHQ